MIESTFSTMANVEFVNLWAFAFIPLPLLMYLLAPAHKQSKDSLQVPYFDMLVELSGEKPAEGATVQRRRIIQGVMVWLAWGLFVTAAARPEWVGEPVEIEKSARDLMVAVDLSGSMETPDFKISEDKQIYRLAGVKQVLWEFANQPEHDRLGLIVFGDSPYL